MTRRANDFRNTWLLALAAAVVLGVGGPALAFGGEGVEEVTSQAGGGQEQLRGGCGRGRQAPDAGVPGPSRQGRGMHQGGCGLQGPESRGTGDGAGPRRGMGAGRGRCGNCGGKHQDLMESVRALVHEYREDIVREVENLENGVVTVTRSPENPDAVEVIQRHVRQMQTLMAGGGRIRGWDPLFSEIFDHSDQVEMAVETLDDGVRVTETSANPEVVKLIRAHARKVSEFVAWGPAAVHEPTALPDDYRDTE